MLLRFAELIREHGEELALLETLDVGKPIANSLSVDVPFCANCIQYYAEFADKLTTRSRRSGRTTWRWCARSRSASSARSCLGTIRSSSPPGSSGRRWSGQFRRPQASRAVAARRRCCLGRLGKEAGLPDGALNVVPGFGEKAGKALALHPDVDMIAFTGSTEVGKLMLVYAGQSNMKRVALECGGKSPHVVMPDADLDAAAEAIAWGIYYNQGETCHAGSRVLAHALIREAWLRKSPMCRSRRFRSAIPLTRARSSAPSSRSATCSACSATSSSASRRARGSRRRQASFCRDRRILRRTDHLDGAKQRHARGPGGDLRAGRRRHSVRRRGGGVRLANDTIYGLAAAVWTRDMNAAHRLSRAIRAGTVWVNAFDRSSLATPFGGFKQSGFGRDRSPHAIDKYMDFKTIWTNYR